MDDKCSDCIYNIGHCAAQDDYNCLKEALAKHRPAVD